MSNIVNLSRRAFLQTSALAAGGLLLGFHLPARTMRAATETAAESFAPNAFIRIGSDDTITLIVNKSEMGQGVYTSLPMLIAEELDADWNQVRVEPAPVDPAYNHTVFGIQATGGSTSVASSWEQLRTAGATARAMLVAAAAENWGVDAATLRTENSQIGAADGQRASYGELADAAAKLTPPKEVKLKDPKDFQLLGKSIKRLEGPDKVTGKAQFGFDMQLPGLLTAVVARPPVFGAKVKSFNADKTKAVAGVKLVKQIDSGVAVIAEHFWAAKTGRDALQIDWDEGPNAALSTESMHKQYNDLLQQPGAVAKDAGDVDAAFAKADKTLEAVYEFPYLAHAMMEPLNCTVHVRADSCEIWTGTQFQTTDRMAAAQVLGLKPAAVRLHTMLLGGGFGRRANPASDFVVEAVQVAKGVAAPVKTVWLREDDMRGGYYRPMFLHRLEAALDADGKPSAVRQRAVGQSILAGTPFAEAMIKDGIDRTSVEGMTDMPYAIANQHMELHSPSIAVPVLWWRSVGHTHTAMVVEAFLDEIAHAGGKDPVALRLELLGDHARHKAVLELAAEKAGWGESLPAGRGRGVALHKSFESYVAEVAEVTVKDNGNFTVDRVVCAVDCGFAVNPDTVKAQMESAILFALSTVLYNEITLQDGRVRQSNFHDYQIARMGDTPKIEVYIVPSDAPPTGAGEPGTPPLAPAVANALFAATGKRVRRLPVRSGDLKA